ncbi:hypothetical protein BJ322DRAFT_1063012 [Thelephora terrestris]|uniref:Uncharacterized protein n=1 Tax=Thelephora terrestris TaxID=56493 RepID=A0A9P6L720_9AGAM|nr:hypothetical protein BJ322DRAFT_1063012 [Thelephora terrestris]
MAAAPPPCSPKSIYVLANLLGIQPLCSVALADIKSKVSLGNVVNEIFSPVTAGREEITEVGWDLLIPNLKDSETFARVKENVGLMSSGPSSRCVGTLKVGLKKSFELKKQKRQPSGVKLRCSYLDCSQYHTYPSYSSLRSYYCQLCMARNRWSPYLRCTGCTHVRDGNYTSCQRCGKKLI